MSAATFSSRIASALQQRSDEEVLFAHVSIPNVASTASTTATTAAASGAPCGVVDTVVTLPVWRAFVSLLKRHVTTAAPCAETGDASLGPGGADSADAAGSSPSCDVGIYCSDTFHTCVLESACLLLGLSFCPFRPDDPPLRLARLEQRRRPRHKLSRAQIASLLQAAMEEVSAPPAQPNSGTGVPSPSPTAARTPAPAAASAPSFDDSRIAYFMHTSGSTGEPKCVMASRGNLRAYADNFLHCSDGLAISCDPPCRLFCLSSPFFDPSIGDVVATLCTPRSTFYTCSHESLLNGCLGALLTTVRPTHVVSTPAVWRTVSETALPADGASGGASRDVMRVFLGGERMAQDLVTAWAARVELYNIYGVTEATIYQSVRRVYPGTRATDVTCGPGVGTHIVIDVGGATRESETQHPLRPCADGEEGGVGEVVLYGEQVCCGYADECPQQRSPDVQLHGGDTSSPFGYDAVKRAAFFRTGDIGKLVPGCESGEPPQLVLRGRRDWQVKLNGQRVSLEEVEGVAQRALEGVCRQCACFCVRRGGEAGVAAAASPPLMAAAAVLADGPPSGALDDHTEAITAALQLLLALYLPTFMIPRRWRLYPSGSALPQTATGKVNRTELARLTVAAFAAADACVERRVDGRDASADSTGGQDALYETVRAAWSQHLGVAVHQQTHYLHAGGDSLGALKLSRALYLTLQGGARGGGGEDGIDEHGGLPPPFQPCVLLQHPRLADYVAALRRALPALASPAQREGGDDSSRGVTETEAPAEGEATHASAALLGEVVAAQCCGLAERLLEHALVDVNGDNTRGHRCVTPLHIAVSSCSRVGEADEAAALCVAQRMVHLLLRHGAKPTAVTPDGVTPAHLAAAVSAELLRLLLSESPALLHCRDGRQQSLLHFAARSGNVAAVSCLLTAHGVALDTRDKWQRTPVHWAVLNGHVEVLEAMAAHFAAASLPAVLGGEAVEEGNGDVDSGGTLKRPRRQNAGTARFTRLARKKTYLAYETLCGIAQRTCPGEARVTELCRALSPAVGEALPGALE